MDFTFEILRTGKTFQLQLEGNLQLQDVAEYFLDVQEIESMNIGVYSENKQQYTENLAEQLTNLGSGSGDTYKIAEGHLKDQFKNPNNPIDHKQITFYLTGLVQKEMNESISMTIGDLIQKISSAFNIRDFQLILQRNQSGLDLNSQPYLMQTIQQVGFNKGQQLGVKERQQSQQSQHQQQPSRQQYPQQQQQQYQNFNQQQQTQDSQTLININIMDGNTTRIMNQKADLKTINIQEIQNAVSSFLGLGTEYAQVDIFINDILYAGQAKLQRTLFELGANAGSNIQAKIRYIGGSKFK